MTNQNDNKRPEISDGKRNQVRGMIYPMAGFFVIYQAYCMYQEISVTSGNQQMLMIVFSILYTIAGAGLILWGFSIAYKSSKKLKEQRESELSELDEQQEE